MIRLLSLYLLFSSGLCCLAQGWELGGGAGYGVYRNGTVYTGAGTVTAGVRNRFAVTAWLTEHAYQNLSGELRYTYQDGDPFLQKSGVRTNLQGQSHTLTYDVLIQVREPERRFRPYFAAGLGAKQYVVSGPGNPSQPFTSIAQLISTDELKFVAALGGGFSYRWRSHIVLRVDFLDYLTTFPKKIIVPAQYGTRRGIFQQFTPLAGIAYTFGSS